MRKLVKDKLPEDWARFILPIFRHKYFIAFGVFVFWVAIIDSNNIFDRMSALSELNKLKETKTYYQEKVERDTRLLNELKRNNEVLERYAREKYLMKKDNEEIFLVIEE